MPLLDSQHADELSALLAVFDAGSFVAAAAQLQRHPTVLSRRLSALEARLGIRLLERSTRQLRFTSEGQRFVAQVREAMALLDQAQRQASEAAAVVRGSLRLSLPASMGRRWLSPMVAGVAKAHPQVVMDVEYAERFVDIIGEHFDAAIRIGSLADSSLVATRLCDHRRLVCAAPSYLAEQGWPHTPQDLAQHRCLGFTGLRSYPHWQFSRGAESCLVSIRASMVSNDNEALLVAARQGLGIIAGGDWLLGPEVAAGHLQEVLPQWQLQADAGIYLVRPSSQWSSAASSAWRDWVIAHFAQGAPWRQAAAAV